MRRATAKPMALLLASLAGGWTAAAAPGSIVMFVADDVIT